MPHGCSGAIPVIVETIANFKWNGLPVPERFSIIDLGAGRGCNGAAIRAYNDEAVYSITGIEGYADHAFLGSPGRDPRLSIWGCYDEMRTVDIRQEVPAMIERGERYSIGICTELIEHLTREEGEALLDQMPFLADHWILSTPDRHFPVSWQDVPLQGHISLWSEEDFTSRGWQIVRPRHGEWPEHGWPMFMAYYGAWDLRRVQCIRTE